MTTNYYLITNYSPAAAALLNDMINGYSLHLPIDGSLAKVLRHRLGSDIVFRTLPPTYSPHHYLDYTPRRGVFGVFTPNFSEQISHDKK